MHRTPRLDCSWPRATLLPFNSSSRGVSLARSFNLAITSVSSSLSAAPSSALKLIFDAAAATPPPARATWCLRTRQPRAARPWARAASASRSAINVVVSILLRVIQTRLPDQLERDYLWTRWFASGRASKSRTASCSRSYSPNLVESVLQGERAIPRAHRESTPLCDALHRKRTSATHVRALKPAFLSISCSVRAISGTARPLAARPEVA